LKILRPYQQIGLDYCMSIDNPALFWDMRTGKTTVAIHACLKWGAKKILVVAPYSTLMGWQKDVYEDTRKKITVLNQIKNKRYEMLVNKFYVSTCHFFFASKECYLFLPQLKDYPWDVVILDESVFIKKAEKNNNCHNFGTRPNASRYYCSNFRNVKHRMILSGLPNPETDMDYYQQLKFLNHDYVKPFLNYYEYRKNNCVFVSYGRKYYFKSESKRELMTLVAEKCNILKRFDIGFTDPKIYETNIIPRNKLFNEILRKMINDMILINAKNEIVDMTVWPFVRFLWYRKLCGGFVQDKVVFKSKLKSLQELLLRGSLKNEQAVVWVTYINELHLINDNIKNSCVIHGELPVEEKINRIKRFKRHAFKYLICTPCIDVGTDLSFCDALIYYSAPVSYNKRAQTEDRIINVASKNQKLIIDFLVEDSIDMDIYYSTKRKEHRKLLTERVIRRMQKEIDRFFIQKTR